jgi:hypothetical protein
VTGTALVAFSPPMLTQASVKFYSSTTEVDVVAMAVRMLVIEDQLRAAARPVLDLSEETHEWFVIDDVLATVSAHPEQKPKGGRPRGGVAEAARRLPLPKYMSESARRQLVQRRLRIARIFPHAKEEARFQRLDDNQTALLAIAAEESEEAQVAVARAWRFRNVPPGSAPRQLETYTITGLETLTGRQHQKLERVMKLVASRFRASVLHANPPSIDE